MNWTQSQRGLMERAMSPAKAGCLDIDIILCDYGSGLTSAARFMVDRTEKAKVGPRVLKVPCDSLWNVQHNLAELAGVRANGFGCGSALCRIFYKLSDEGERPLSILLDSAHFLNARDMERLALNLEWACETIHVPARAFFLVKKFEHFRKSQSKQGYESVFNYPELPALFNERAQAGRLSMSRFDKTELDQFTKKEVKNLLAQAS
jgi:hypothetical protein